MEHNEAHGIVPAALVKPIHDVLEKEPAAVDASNAAGPLSDSPWDLYHDLVRQAAAVRQEMKREAGDLQFERAAVLRDEERRLLLDARILERELVDAGIGRP